MMTTVKSLLFAILFSLSATDSLTAQWQKTNGPFGGTVETMISPSAGLFIVGTVNGIYKSNDNCITWTLVGLEYQSITQLIVGYSGYLFAMTSNGDVYRSSDNGDHWIEVNNVYSQPTGQLFLFHPNSIVVRYYNTLYRSSDNGSSWSTLNTPLSHVYSLRYLSDDTLIAATDNGIRLSTNNGITWTDSCLLGRSIADVIDLGNGTFLALSAWDSLIFRSTDFRKSWSAINTSILSFTYASTLVTQQTSYITSPYSCIISKDNGMHWETLYHDYCSSILSTANNTLYMGTSYGVISSSDAGVSWKRMSSGINATVIYGLAFNKPNQLLAAAFYEILSSTDNGQNWTSLIDSKRLGGVYQLATSPSGAIFAAANNGIFESTDRGANWTKSDSSIRGCRCVAISNKGYVAVGTLDGMYLATDDRATWKKVHHYEGYHGGVNFDSAGLIYLGFNDELLTSPDNGISWKQLGTTRNNVTGTAEIAGIVLRDSNQICVETYEAGFIFTMADGLVNRQLLHPGEHASFFVNESKDIFLGSPGYIYVSIDGGSSWQIMDTLAPSTATCFTQDKKGIVYAGTNIGGIYRTTRTTTSFKLEQTSIEVFRPKNDTTKNTRVLISDASDDSLIITQIKSSNSFIVPEFGEFQIGGRENYDFRIRLTAATYGIQKGRITLSSNSFIQNRSIDILDYYGVPFLKILSHFFDLGQIYFGGKKDTTIILSNPTFDTLSIESIQSSSTEFKVTPGGGIILPMQTMELHVGFSPTNPTSSAIVIIYSNSGQYLQESISKDTINLSGRGYAKADVKQAGETPYIFALYQNYPNPFNPSSTISFDLPVSCIVSLTIYDYLGREISSIANGFRTAGHHEERFNGSKLASGIYFYRIQANRFFAVRKMLLLK